MSTETSPAYVSASGPPRAAQRTAIIPLLALAAAATLGHAIVLKAIGPNVWAIALVHAAMLGGAGWLVRMERHKGHDTSIPFLGLLAGAAIGPIGPAGAAIAGLVRSHADLELLDRWYERISQSTAVDPVSRLSDDVNVGRTVNLHGPMPASFLVTMEAGTLAERQAVLGIIARRFHADYIPILQIALKSPEPVVRVQAAAVAARVRPEIARRFRECLGELPAVGRDFAAALSLLQKIEAYVSSGLLDEGDRQHGLEIAGRLGDIVLSELRRRRPARGSSAATSTQRETLERLLIERTAYAELRSLRAADRVLASRSRARVRRIGELSAPRIQELPVHRQELSA